ncbi:conserved hypothetical protein [Psychromonas ingrahamii 37]|uniref:Uncharacterized protein n=2 Tax=Psychromonas ingrahamii TaxID=357794 RepID=A1SRX9_PSYIN|nr:conserved hypothetical protein [Psychromonas ingrahamii 37]
MRILMEKKQQRIDFQGKIFGSLFVIERASSDRHLVPDNFNYWLCICKCGDHLLVENKQFLNRIDPPLRSCGCHRKVNNSLVNNQYGCLTVLCKTLNQGQTVKRIRGHIAYLCLCRCGSKYIAIGQALLKEKVKSCGCDFEDKAE